MSSSNDLAVTDNEQKHYNSIVGQIMNPHLPTALPPTLWHYTRGDSLIKIIESGSLWSTQISCLNDQTELQFSRDLLKTAIGRLRQNDPNCGGAVDLCDRIEQGLGEEAVSTSEWFVLSFSEIRDDLSQWRAYGGGEGGYALGLAAIQVAHSANVNRGTLVPVIYTPTIHNKIADDVTSETVKLFIDGLQARPGVDRKAWMDSFLTAWEKAVTYIAPLLKHPAFKDEVEWRVIRPLTGSDFTAMKYLQRGGLMSRHLPLNLCASGTKILPVTEVTVGPTRYPRVSQVSVTDLLRTNGYAAGRLVKISTVPYQTP